MGEKGKVKEPEREPSNGEKGEKTPAEEFGERESSYTWERMLGETKIDVIR